MGVREEGRQVETLESRHRKEFLGNDVAGGGGLKRGRYGNHFF
jgi:hypothetical protein